MYLYSRVHETLSLFRCCHHNNLITPPTDTRILSEVPDGCRADIAEGEILHSDAQFGQDAPEMRRTKNPKCPILGTSLQGDFKGTCRRR